MKIEGAVAGDAVRILGDAPGVTVVPGGRPDAGTADAMIRYAGVDAPVVIEVKHRVNAASARQVVSHARTASAPVLLVVANATAEARAILRRHGVGVIDGLGNMHVELPGLLIHVDGRRPASRARGAPARLRGKAAVVAQALLLAPGRAWGIHELAADAGVSAGLAHRVVARLEQEGVVSSEGRGPRRVRRVVDAAALLDLWAEENEDHAKRTPAFVLARTPRALIDALSSSLAAAGVDHAVTGAAAASIVAPLVTAVPVVEVWTSETAPPAALCTAVGGEPVDDGHNVVFLQAKRDGPLAFRQKLDDAWLVNAFRLYVDLRGDPRRGPEQADHLRREVIGA